MALEQSNQYDTNDAPRRLLIVTTEQDKSTNYLVESARSINFEVDVLHYGANSLEDGSYSYVYFRDPFNEEGFDEARTRRTMELVVESSPEAVYIDKVRDYQGLLIEDKWRQYELLAEFMPQTNLLHDAVMFDEANQIAKERLSSRGRGVVFTKSNLKSDKEYVVQSRLDIQKEYRVFGVNGQIESRIAVRSSKTLQSKVKMLSVEPAMSDLVDFVQSIYDRLTRFDLVGFDIAKLTDGRLILIEINRSPQFARYNEMTGANLADKLMKGML